MKNQLKTLFPEERIHVDIQQKILCWSVLVIRMKKKALHRDKEEIANVCLKPVCGLMVDYSFKAKLSIFKMMIHLGTKSFLFFPGD